jgi:hypothetical protein
MFEATDIQGKLLVSDLLRVLVCCENELAWRREDSKQPLPQNDKQARYLFEHHWKRLIEVNIIQCLGEFKDKRDINVQ